MSSEILESGTEITGRGEPTAMSVSIVLEWENMTYAEQVRPRLTIAALKAQAAALYSPECSLPAKAETAVRLSAPLDVILPFNSDKVSEAEFRASVPDLLTESESLRLRLLPVANGTYCNQKNAGAAGATGELVIFLDSDVTPEPDWLAAYMRAFVDPRICAAVGNTYVDTSGGDAYSRSMALTWMFPLRDAAGGLTRSEWFYANNAAFRRSTLLANPFPQTPRLKHRAAALLVQQLEKTGITLWHVGEARANHPAPNGAMHFVSRAVAGGRARMLSSEAAGLASILKWVRADLLEIGWFFKRIVTDGFKVNLQWWQVPAAMSFTLTYYGLRFCGSVATYLAPGLMRGRFDL